MTLDEYSQDFLKSILDYDPDTGTLTWKWRGESMFSSVRDQRAWNTRFAGQPAGSVDKGMGYIRLHVAGRLVMAHRIIWIWMTGGSPPDEIDHDNRVRDDNRWRNLVASTRQHNAKNKSLQTNNSSGVAGVSLLKSGRYMARGGVSGNRIHLGYFADLATAAEARKEFERVNGYHPKYGRPHRDEV